MIGLAMMLAASGTFVSGNELYALCTGDVDDRIRCIEYVTGASDSALIAQRMDGRTGYLCIPERVTRQQIADVVTAYLRDHPESRQSNAGGLTLVALGTAFPCH